MVLQAAERVDPDLDVLPLRPAHLAFGTHRQVGQIAVLDSDEIWFAEDEVEVEVDQAVECVGGTVGVGGHVGGAGE